MRPVERYTAAGSIDVLAYEVFLLVRGMGIYIRRLNLFLQTSSFSRLMSGISVSESVVGGWDWDWDWDSETSFGGVDILAPVYSIGRLSSRDRWL